MLIELMIAYAIFALTLTALVLLEANDARSGERLTLERLTREVAATTLARARIQSLMETFAMSSTLPTGASLSVLPISSCAADATSTATQTASYGIRYSATFTEQLFDQVEMQKRGNDCLLQDVHFTTFTTPTTVFSGVSSTTALDVLGGIAYMGIATSPYLAIAVASGTPQGYVFGNNFSLPASITDLDAWQFSDGTTLKTYVFATLASTSTQVAVIDASDPTMPVLVALRSLKNVDPAGSYPQGWHILAYGTRLYVTTRETSGPELHIFDITSPENPLELGSGTKLGITLNDFTVRDEMASGTMRRYLYAATDRTSGELAVYDVTDPNMSGAVTELTELRKDLPGNQNGESIAVLGTRLYIGRASVPTGPELYVYDTTAMPNALTLLGTAEVGTSVIRLIPTSAYLFMGMTKSRQQLQAWDVHNPALPTRISTYTVPGMPARGMDVDAAGLFAAGTNAPLEVFATP